MSDVKGKLSGATLLALMTHLGQDVECDTTATTKCASTTLGISQKEHATEGLDVGSLQHVRNTNAGVDEQFGMSQFWYTESTAKKIAQEALSLGGKADEVAGIKRIAFVSCPSAFKAALDLDYDKDEYELYLFEYDTRFGDVYGDQFVFFDFNSPYMHEDYVGQFDYVVADPPYLVDTCMKRTVSHMQKLRRDDDTPMGFCTGSVMSESIYEFAQFRESKFHPEHHSKLGNEFSFFTNYDPVQLDGWYPLEDVVKDFDESYFSKTGREVKKPLCPSPQESPQTEQQPQQE